MKTSLKKLTALLTQWEQRSKRKFADAKAERLLKKIYL